MLELEVVLRDEAKVVRAHVFEGADPTRNLVEATDDLTFGDSQVALGVKRIEVALDTIDLEVLRLLELPQVGFSDLNSVGKWLRQRQDIFALLSVRIHRVVQILIRVPQDGVRVDAEIRLMPASSSALVPVVYLQV